MGGNLVPLTSKHGTSLKNSMVPVKTWFSLIETLIPHQYGDVLAKVLCSNLVTCQLLPWVVASNLADSLYTLEKDFLMAVAHRQSVTKMNSSVANKSSNVSTWKYGVLNDLEKNLHKTKNINI